jgi:hypothetical protein
MTERKFEQFLMSAVAELKLKQVDLSTRLGFDQDGRWDFDQRTQRLQIYDHTDRLAVEADVIDVGSFAPQSSSWKWAWSNVSVLPALRGRALKLKELEAQTGFEMFGRPEAFQIDSEATAWELAAVSVMRLGALGCYRAPSPNGLMSFLAIMSEEPTKR